MTDLREGQWQIGDLKFGKGTQISISGMDQVGYEVTPGDYPIPQSDEIRFRRDFIKPGVLQFELSIVDNYVLPGFEGAVNYEPADELLERFSREWRADEVRREWGWVKPLTYRGPGKTRMLFGRPRNLASDRRKSRSGWYGLTCSYQLSDSLSYSEDVTSIPVQVGVESSIARDDGQAPSWLTVYFSGPATNPVFQIGPNLVSMDVTLSTGDILVLAAAPWERRAVVYRASGTDENVGWRMIDGSAFLEDLRLPEKKTWSVKVTASGTSSETHCVVGWREAYHAI